MTLIDKLQKRYASKQMNGKRLPKEKVNHVLEAIRLAPTSLGLQPFKVFVIENQELKQRIFDAAAPGQPQIPNASELLVFACYRKVTKEILDEYFDLIVSTRDLPIEKLTSYRNLMNGLVSASAQENFVWATRQAYIALGFGLVAAADEMIDSVPIEGFNSAVLDDILNLESQNLGSVCLMAIGYRNEETDYNARLPKVRKSKDNLFIHV